MISPIINFTTATNRIARGEFSMKIEKQSNDELGELTDSFNKMAEELKKEREDMLSSNEQVRAEAKEIVTKFLSAQGRTSNFNMSELERPLTRVKDYLTEIKKDVGNKKAKQTSEVIEDIEQIDAFLKDLFEHSSITVNIADFAPVDFFDTFKSALEKLQHEVKQNNANIKCGHLPTTKALRSSIIQLFENLLSNAIKYRSERSPEIIVSSEDKGSHWQFSVKDNGCGIERDEVENIFRVRENQNNGHFKFNFGLALCKNIVERHGGNIWVESKPGIGSTFFFTIMKY
jgi:signal transduction histidine kinase